MSLRALALAAVLAAASCPLAAQQQAPTGNDPVSEGRKLSAWVADLQAPSPETRHDAAYNIAWMGPAAAPAETNGVFCTRAIQLHAAQSSAHKSAVGYRCQPIEPTPAPTCCAK